MKSVVKYALVGLFVGVMAVIVCMGTIHVAGKFRSVGPDYTTENRLLQEQLNSLAEERDQRLEYSNGLEDEIAQREHQRKMTLQQFIDQIQESTDQILEINRLQDELQKAKDPNLVYSPEQDLYAPASWVDDPKVLPSVPELPPTFSDIVEQVIGSIVHIQTPGLDRKGQEVIYHSTGIVIAPRIIVTASHVVEDTVDFHIFTVDGHELKATRAISHKNSDIAFIYIDDLTCIGSCCSVENSEGVNVLKGEHEVELKAVELGSIKDCRLGQDVFVIGASLGQQHFPNVTKGIISSLDLDLGKYDPVPLPSGWETTEEMGWSILWMTDTATYGGNSGSPVFTTGGEVVGVLVGGYRDYESISYCVPIDVIVDNIDIIKLMFVMDKYEVEKKSDNRLQQMGYQVVTLQQQISHLQADNEDLLDIYEWFLENKEALEELCEIEEPEKIITQLILMVQNLRQSVTLAEYLNGSD